MNAKHETWKVITPLIILWVGILVSSASTSVFRTNDSDSYTGPISLVGNYTRGWPSVAFYHLFPPDALAVFAQALVYGGAWTVLLLAWSLRKPDAVRLVFGMLLVVLALTPAMVGWSVTILAEPLTISLVILGIGLMGFALQPASREQVTSGTEEDVGIRRAAQHDQPGWRGRVSWELLLLTAAALCFSLAAINRITALPLVFVPLVALAISARRQSNGLVAAGVVGLLSIVVIFYPLYYNSESNKAWKDYFGVTASTIHFYYGTAVTGFSPQFSDHVFYGVIDEGPACLQEYRATFGGQTPWDVVGRLVKECPEGAKWLEDERDKEYAKTLISHPRVTLKHIGKSLLETGPGLGFSQALYGSNQVVTVLPAGVASLFDSSVSDQSRNLPFLLWFLVGGLVAGGGAVFREIRTPRWWVGIGLFAASSLGIVLTILAMVDEFPRTAATSTAPLLVVSVLLLQEAVVRYRRAA